MVVVMDAVAVKSSSGKTKDSACRAAVLGMVTLVTVGACADAGPRHLAPPPRSLDGAVAAAGPGLSAFSGAVAAPPNLSAYLASTSPSRGTGPVRDSAAAADAAEKGPAEVSQRRLEADARSPVGSSMLTRLGATAAPFSRESGGDRRADTAEPTLASLARPADGASPTRTAMRVRPVTPPFSGRRPATSEPVQSHSTKMARSEEPPVMPFVGTRSARDALRAAASPQQPTFADPTFPQPSYAEPSYAEPSYVEPSSGRAPGPTRPDPSFAYAAPPAAAVEPPLPWDVTRGAAPLPSLESVVGARRGLDHPMFLSAAEAYATVIVSDRGVEVIAEEASPDDLVFAALPADPGDWAAGRGSSLTTIGFADEPVAAAAAPAGEMIATLLFADGAVDFGDAERQILREVARIQQIDNRKVTLAGHASGRTRASNAMAQARTNMRISRQRAEAAVRALAEFGVPRSRMTVAPMGDTRPLYAEIMPAGEAGNRRVEVYLDY